MLRPSHEFALAAAALVSFACHRSGSEPPADGGSGESEAQPPVVAEPDPYAADPELDPSLNKPPISEARQALESCQAQVSSLVNSGTTLGPADVECCRSIAHHVYDPVDPPSEVDPQVAAERSAKDYEVWGLVYNGCCQLIDYSEAACTPWGPPTPPSRLAVHSRSPGRLDLRSFARAKAPAGIASDELDECLRASAIATWRARMVNEYGSAPVFEGLLAQLEGLVRQGLLDESAIARARHFAGQERRHGILCGAVVEALGGAAEAEALPQPEFPQHPDAQGDLEACLRNVLSICCLSETVAVSLIAAERHEMPEGPLRELLGGIWTDECGHANFGWQLLPELLAHADAETLAGLAEYLKLAFRELETHELAHLPADFAAPRGGEVYGLCSGAEARSLFWATVERVIVPGLEARGLPARVAWDMRAAA